MKTEENVTESTKSKIKIGDKVYLKATVQQVPTEFTNMYKVITQTEGVAVWATLDELVEIAKAEGGLK